MRYWPRRCRMAAVSPALALVKAIAAVSRESLQTLPVLLSEITIRVCTKWPVKMLLPHPHHSAVRPPTVSSSASLRPRWKLLHPWLVLLSAPQAILQGSTKRINCQWWRNLACTSVDISLRMDMLLWWSQGQTQPSTPLNSSHLSTKRTNQLSLMTSMEEKVQTSRRICCRTLPSQMVLKACLLAAITPSTLLIAETACFRQSHIVKCKSTKNLFKVTIQRGIPPFSTVLPRILNSSSTRLMRSISLRHLSRHVLKGRSSLRHTTLGTCSP